MAVAFRSAASRVGSTNTPVGNKPTGVAQGDILVASVYTHYLSSVIDPPTGWTQIVGLSVNDRMRHYWKIAGASEPSTWNWEAMGGSYDWSVCVEAYTGGDQTNPINVGAAQSSGTSNTVVVPALSTLRAGAMVCIVVGAYTNSSTAPNVNAPVNFTERVAAGYTGGVQTGHKMDHHRSSRAFAAQGTQPQSNALVSGGAVAVTKAAIFSIEPPANTSPTANFSYSASNLTYSFTDASTDPDGTIASRSWNFGDGTTSTATNPTKTYSASGTYTVTLTVTDNAGASSTKQVTITTNRPPSANFSSGGSGLTVNFTDLSADADGTIASRSWNFGDGGTSTATNPSRTYAAAGTYTVTLTVTDDDGATASVTKNISVSPGAPPNQGPTANFSVSGNGYTRTFTDTSTDADGTIASRSWNFGDGGTSTLQSPLHTFAGPGNYNVTLTVTDNLGATGSVTKTVIVFNERIAGGVMTHDAAASLLVDHQYRWSARAYDGTLWGQWSDWETFTYRSTPVVDILMPRPFSSRNRINSPSAERDPVGGTFWTEINRVEDVDAIDAVGDADSAFGLRSWRAVASQTSANYYESVYETVDATKPIFCLIHAKKEEGIAAFSFRVDCYNNSDTLLGSIFPSSVRGAQGIDADEHWTTYGGIVWPAGSANSPKYPTGTTKIKFAVLPSIGSEAVMRFDSVFYDEVPLLSASDWNQAQNWFGYFDGDTVGYGTDVSGATYGWTGAEGDSESYGWHVVRGTDLNMYITYSHPSGRPKASDRVILEKQVAGGIWRQLYDSGHIGGARTTIPLPDAYIKNEGRYQVRLSVKDDVGIAAELAPVVFDVRYDGPPEPNIIVARGDAATAEIYVSWESTTLSLTKFGGYEVMVGPDKTVHELVADPARTDAVFPYPVSGEVTDVWVRQVENRGADQVEGRADHAEVVVDYGPSTWWIKDTADPRGIAVPIFVYAKDEPGTDSNASVSSYRPWGKPEPVHIVGEGREESGSLTCRILENEANMDATIKAIKAIRDRRKVVCLLSQRPAERKFVMITGFRHTAAHLPFRAVYELTWERSTYSENFYEREGALSAV